MPLKVYSLSDDITFVYVNCVIVIGLEHPTIILNQLMNHCYVYINLSYIFNFRMLKMYHHSIKIGKRKCV